mgnify:CR=1 FL=1
MAFPILYMVGSVVVRAAAPAIMRQLTALGAKKLGKQAVEAIVKAGTKIVTPNAGNISRLAKNARGKNVAPNSGKGTQVAKPKNTQGVTGGRNTQLTKPKNTQVAKNSGKGTQVAKNSGKGTQVAKNSGKGTQVAKPRANSGKGDSKIVGVNPKAFRNAAAKAQLLGTVIDSKPVTTKPAPASSPSRPSGPSTRPSNRPTNKPSPTKPRPAAPLTRPNNKPTSGAMTLRTYLNKAIDKRGSTLSKEKAKGKNFKSIAAAKKGKSLYYMKGDTVMAAVYKEDLKK